MYLKRRYCGGRWTLSEGGLELFRPSRVKVERYRYRGSRILLPWMTENELGNVGRYASSDFDDSAFVGAIEEALPGNAAPVESRMR
jgi:RNA-directed DNA polymerase